MLENNFNISVPDEWLDGDRNDYFVVSVKENNYYPYFNYGDLLIICKDLSRVEENDIRVYEIKGTLELRKYGLSTNGNVLLFGLTGYIPKIENASFKLCGFVYMRITNYRKGAVNNGKNEID